MKKAHKGFTIAMEALERETSSLHKIIRQVHPYMIVQGLPLQHQARVIDINLKKLRLAARGLLDESMSKKEADINLTKTAVAKTSNQVADEPDWNFITKPELVTTDDQEEQIETSYREKIATELTKHISRSITHGVASDIYNKVGDMIENGIDERLRDLIKKHNIEVKAESGNKVEVNVPAQTARFADMVISPLSQAEHMAMDGRAVRKESKGVYGDDQTDALAELCQKILRESEVFSEIEIPSQTARFADKVISPLSQAENMAMTGAAVREESRGVFGDGSGDENALAELCQKILREQEFVSEMEF